MRLASLYGVLLGGVQLATGAVVPTTPRSPSERCVPDELLRFFRNHREEAVPFCHGFLDKVKTVTVTKTITLTQMESITETNTATVVSTSMVTITVPTTVTSSTTTTTTSVVPSPTYPTRPFRMYHLDSAGTRQYFDRRDWIQGDLIASTPDVSLAETFTVDADQHLFFTDGFSTGTTVYAFYGPTYFDDNLAKVVYFNTPEFISSGGFIYHVWTVDLDTLSIGLANPARRLQLCNRVYNSMLMVGNAIDGDCVARGNNKSVAREQLRGTVDARYPHSRTPLA
ncbi:hypothetical protein QBC34DRAFT_424068 [Podospora aff. communis PSN243]|uniref:Uncharacterized protein n=1 Tax=Podospora aff. communis PSN243 TaxID=3040156 RepID=A0AAV9GQY2_9PEZI|nr:hypothetical protein QBC34DRAFT_424068 [Podospora aff. communis PSN243]